MYKRQEKGYKEGDGALRSAAIQWLSDPDNKAYFSGLMKGTYAATFGGDDVDALIKKLPVSYTHLNRPVLWTKDQPKPPAKAAPVIPTIDGQISLDAFKRFLVQEKGFAERTAGNYWTSIRMIEAYIQRNNLDFSLLNTDCLLYTSRCV